MRDLQHSANRVAALLETTRTRIVFAESCTGGLVSAVLTRVPGISNWHCGSAVVYQIATKSCWLGVPESLLVEPVSAEVAVEMANRVLDTTPHADLAASITGHLGPSAPAGQDGLVYVGVVGRGDPTAVTQRHVLPSDSDLEAAELRQWRQSLAAELVFAAVEGRLTG